MSKNNCKDELFDNFKKTLNELYNTKGGSTGGYGHIVFDDFNVEDHWIESCLIQAKSHNMSDGFSEEVRQLSIKSLEFLKLIPEENRIECIRLAIDHDFTFDAYVKSLFTQNNI